MPTPENLVKYVQKALFENDIASLKRYLNHPRFPQGKYLNQNSLTSLGKTIWPFSIIQETFFKNLEERQEKLSVEGFEILHQKIPFEFNFLEQFDFICFLNQTSPEHFKFIEQRIDELQDVYDMSFILSTFAIASFNPILDKQYLKLTQLIFSKLEPYFEKNHLTQNDFLNHLKQYFIFKNYIIAHDNKNDSNESPLSQTILYLLHKIQKNQNNVEFPWQEFLYSSSQKAGLTLLQLSKEGFIDLSEINWDLYLNQNVYPSDALFQTKAIIEQKKLEEIIPQTQEKMKTARL